MAVKVRGNTRYDVVEIRGEGVAPIPVVEGLSVPEHDAIDLSWDNGNLTGVVYKLAGETVSSLTLAYDGSGNLISVVKS